MRRRCLYLQAIAAILLFSSVGAALAQRGGRVERKGQAETAATSLDNIVQLASADLVATAPAWVKKIGVWIQDPPPEANVYAPALIEGFGYTLTNSPRFTVVDVPGLLGRLGIAGENMLKVGSLRKLSKRAGIQALLYGKIVDTFGMHRRTRDDLYTTGLFKLTDTETAQILWERKVQGKNKANIARALQKGKSSGRYASDRYEAFAANLMDALRLAANGPLRGHRRLCLLDIVNESGIPVDGDRLMDEVELTMANAEGVQGEPQQKLFDLVDRDVILGDIPTEERFDTQLSESKGRVAVRYHVDAFLFCVFPRDANTQVDRIVGNVRVVDPATGVSLWAGRVLGQDEGARPDGGTAQRKRATPSGRSAGESVSYYLRPDVSK